MTSPTDIAERLRAIRERAEKATRGPWFGEYDDTGMVVVRGNDDFIAHAREDIPWLLDRLTLLESLKCRCDECRETYGQMGSELHE